MAYGISVKFPLSLDVNDGAYTLNKTIKESVKQNFKNLLLTSPGERIMDPNFGVGLRNFLFENSDDFTSNDIESKIREQIDIYLPFIDILRINIINDQAHLSWTAISDLDLDYYIIRYSTATSGASWIDSVLLVNKVARPGPSITVPARVGTYLIKAEDKMGNQSPNATLAVSTVTAIAGINSVLTITEAP